MLSNCGLFLRTFFELKTRVSRIATILQLHKLVLTYPGSTVEAFADTKVHKQMYLGISVVGIGRIGRF
jgi:hypothetical protein